MYLWMRRDINVAIPAGFLLTCAFIAVCLPRIGEVSFSMPMATGKAFYNQTPCGQTFWQAIQPYAVGGRYYVARYWHPWG